MASLPPEARFEREHFEKQGTFSHVSAPMVLRNHLVGFIGFDTVSKKRKWTENDLVALRLIGEVFTHAIERKRVEIKLRESEEGWSLALEGSGDGVWDWDAVTNKVCFSKQWKSMMGDHVTSKTKSFEALELLKQNPLHFDLVVTDMTMPQMTGSQLAREILKIRNDMPIILCTGFSDKIDEDAAKAMGIKHFLMKPIEINFVADAVRRALDEK